MRLLITTQVVDVQDPVLGFFHRWLLEFAKHCEQIIVICLREGEHHLPENVNVYSLGKEDGRAHPLVYAARFKQLAWKHRREYGAVFVHMNPEYVDLGGLLWRFSGKPIALWYMHKSVTLTLRIATLLANRIYTASPLSMRIGTPKKRVVGHGIDIAELPLVEAPPYPGLKLLTVGRISRVKNTHLLITVLSMLRESGIDAELTIVGAPATDDGAVYEQELRAQAHTLGIAAYVHFVGPVAHARLPEFFAIAHLFLHASATGSLDKASLEPLASGVPLVTVDAELAQADIPSIMLVEPFVESFTEAIRTAIGARLWDNAAVREGARAYVQEHHELGRLIDRIVSDMKAL